MMLLNVVKKFLYNILTRENGNIFFMGFSGALGNKIAGFTRDICYDSKNVINIVWMSSVMTSNCEEN